MPSGATQQSTGLDKGKGAMFSQPPPPNQPTQPQQGVFVTGMLNQPVNNQTSASSSTSIPNPDAQHQQHEVPRTDAQQ